jgi:hypothetical protein
MDPKPGLALAALIAACAACSALDPPQVRPPDDRRERQRAEVLACRDGVQPAWLDDTALAAAIRADEREGKASRANDAFQGATYRSQPPAEGGGGPRAAALTQQRREFQLWCATLRSRGKGVGP